MIYTYLYDDFSLASSLSSPSGRCHVISDAAFLRGETSDSRRLFRHHRHEVPRPMLARAAYIIYRKRCTIIIGFLPAAAIVSALLSA